MIDWQLMKDFPEEWTERGFKLTEDLIKENKWVLFKTNKTVFKGCKTANIMTKIFYPTDDEIISYCWPIRNKNMHEVTHWAEL